MECGCWALIPPLENREVLVSRSNRRVSRILIAILVVAVAVGIFSFGQKMKRTAPAGVPAEAIPPLVDATPANPATEPSVFADVAATPPATPPDDTPSAAPIVDERRTAPDDSQHAIPAADMVLGPTTAPSLDLLTSAKIKIDQGDSLGARDQLNQALQSGQLDSSVAASVKSMIAQISQTVIFGRQHFGDDPYGGTYVVKPGDSLARIAASCDCTWELLSRINGIDPKHLRAGATIKVVQGPFFAVVDKRRFTMDIYLGGLPGEKSSMYVTTFMVGLGRDDSTPPGMWSVEPHRKLKHPTYYSPRGEGVIAADDPKNPLGGYWIGLTGTEGQAVGKLSYGIHGTIDPDSIGKQSSMGCIRLRNDDVAIVFDLLVEGKSLVLVKE
jgi:lipoprotein-anchoring transpeptidase ErfK/SrfK